MREKGKGKTISGFITGVHDDLYKFIYECSGSYHRRWLQER